MASGSAQAEPVVTSGPSYQLGYARAVRDVQTMASRMRAEGFELADIDISGRIPALCARESATASGEDIPDFDGPEFLQGCTDGMKALVRAGIAY